MAKPYIPRVTVTFRREFDGVIEREQSVSTVGEAAQLLEMIICGVLSLALSGPESRCKSATVNEKS